MSEVRASGPVAARPRNRYYEAAAVWAAEAHGALDASRRAAWRVAAVAAAGAALEAIALFALLPLKTATPYLVYVDHQGGYAQTVSALQPGVLNQDPTLTQSFLAQYVLARETFDSLHLRDQYRKVMLWSSGEARAQYQQQMQATTPDSPLKLYAPTTLVSVTIESVSLLSSTTALVRFDTVRQDDGQPAGAVQGEVAILDFHYSNAPMRMDDRFLSPLGFQVSGYRRQGERPAAPAVSGGSPSTEHPITPPPSPPMGKPFAPPPPALAPLGSTPPVAAPPPPRR